MATTLVPTAEQDAALETDVAGGNLKIKAYAGAGKTATLRMIALRRASQRGRYLAFNRDIAQEAKGRFPSNVICQTVNSLAFNSVNRGLTAKLAYAKEPPHHLAERYGLEPVTTPVIIGKTAVVSAFQLGRMIADGTSRFCRSAQSVPEAWHIPVDEKIEPHAADELRKMLLPHVLRHWEESTNPAAMAGISPDVYMKVWEQSDPRINSDFILFDEAQDSDGLMLSVLRRQRHAQVIYVGDPYQQIYEWRGAVNAMEHIKAPECALTESFRFGPDFATLASKILLLLGERVPLLGQPGIESVLVEDPDAKPAVDAILCRKNSTVIAALAEGIAAGHKVAVRTNLEEIMAFAEGAERLMRGERAYGPAALTLFESWRDVQEYAKSHAGRDLQALVTIIEDGGAAQLKRLLRSVTPEEQADYVVSTVHRAKGLEWNRVKVMGDFRFRTDEWGRTTLADDEKRLLYVALTRARTLLDVSAVRDDLVSVVRTARAAQPQAATRGTHGTRGTNGTQGTHTGQPGHA